MKIDSAQQNYAAELDSEQEKPAGESRQLPQQGKASYKLHLSAHTQQASAEDKTEEEARRAKVEAIMEQLASGTYSISGKDVATKMLRLLKG